MDQLNYFSIDSKYLNPSQFFDLNNPKLVLILWGFSYFFFISLHKFFGSLKNYLPQYNSILQDDVRINYLIRVVSTIHATLVASCALLILCFDSDVYLNELLYKSYPITFTLSAVMGYFSYDFTMMIMYKESRDSTIMVHHFLAILAFYHCIRNGVFPLIALVRLTSEFSNPFLNIRWFMLTLNKKSNKLFLYNAFLLFLSFIVFRIIPIIPLWKRIILLIGTPVWNDIGLLQKCVLLMTTVPLDIMNVYWCFKIIQKALKYSKEGDKLDKLD